MYFFDLSPTYRQLTNVRSIPCPIYPLREPVAGIAMGLILEPNGEFTVLSDILGSEDALGDMDFK